MDKEFFKWKKLGLVWGPSAQEEWMDNSCLTPTPIYIKSKKVIRVYSSIRDKNGIGRIGYVDLDSENPIQVVSYSNKPVLDIGREGAFDDNGVILGDIMVFKRRLYMYYVGFQLVQKAKFLAFSGCAEANSAADTFCRISEAPILDRDSDSIYINAIHTAYFDRQDNAIHAWTGSGNSWKLISGKPFPSYTIRRFSSKDVTHFTPKQTSGIKFEGDEYRIGRPRVYKTNKGYIMFYTKGSESGEYICECAVSFDGENWKRNVIDIGICTSKTGWDSKHLCYPVLIRVDKKIFMFYNGNDMGFDGFGVAELIKGNSLFPENEPNLDKSW